MRAIEGLADAFRSAASLPAALWLLAAWSAAEALWWPIVPDVALAVLAFTNPAGWPWMALATAAGSMAGGLVAYGLGRRGLVPAMPMTTARMAEAVDGWLAGGTAGGLRHQPLSGVPFKVFAYRAAGNRVGPAPFVAAAALARGARMLAVAAAAAALGRVFWTASPAATQPRLYVLLLALAVAGFAVGLARIRRRWA
jgi:membrane protein YqaA with SNARE-associated domain